MTSIRKELINNIWEQVKADERLFGEGLLRSWTDFQSFTRAYQSEDEKWTEEESEILRLIFLMNRSSVDISDVFEFLKGEVFCP